MLLQAHLPQELATAQLELHPKNLDRVWKLTNQTSNYAEPPWALSNWMSWVLPILSPLIPVFLLLLFRLVFQFAQNRIQAVTNHSIWQMFLLTTPQHHPWPQISLQLHLSHSRFPHCPHPARGSPEKHRLLSFHATPPKIFFAAPTLQYCFMLGTLRAVSTPKKSWTVPVLLQCNCIPSCSRRWRLFLFWELKLPLQKIYQWENYNTNPTPILPFP